MGNPTQISVDDGDKELLERAAARHGVTVQEYLKRVAAGTLRPLPAWQTPQPHLPAAAAAAPTHAPKTVWETIEEAQARMFQMQMMKAMPSMFGDMGGAKPLTAEDVERILTDRLRGREGDSGDDGMLKIFREGMRMKMLAKAMSGMEEDAPPALKKEMQEVRERFEKAQAELMGKLQSKDDEIRRKEDAEREANRAQQIDALRLDSLAAIQKLEQQVLQFRSTNTAQPPRDQIDQLAEGLTRLDALRGKLDTVFGGKESKSQKPWWIDEIREMINVAGDNAGKVLEGVGAVEAGRRGLQPPGQSGNSPPGTAPVYTPNYVDTREAPPRPAGTSDPYPILAGYATDPADLSTWPDIPYSETDSATQQPTPLTKAAFVTRYGSRIHAERVAAGVMPNPAPAATDTGDPMASLYGGSMPGVESASEKGSAPSAPKPATPQIFDALSGGAPLTTTQAPAPVPAESKAPAVVKPPEPVAETESASVEPAIPEGVYGRDAVNLPTTVDLDGNAIHSGEE